MAVQEYEENILCSPSQTIVVPVNCGGVAGKGLALYFRNKVPGWFDCYRRLCKQRLLTIDKLHSFKRFDKDQRVLSFPTKVHFSNKSKITQVEANLRKLVALHKELHITSLAICPVGCGEGGLDYAADVRPLMFEILGELPFEVRIALGNPNYRKANNDK